MPRFQRHHSPDGTVRVAALDKTFTLRGAGRFGRGRKRTLAALHNVSFDVPAGQATAILGHNGSGKSTLLKILAGVTAGTTGDVHVPGRIASLLELGAGFHPDLNGWENIRLQGQLLGLPEGTVAERMASIAAFSGLSEFLEAPLRTYSSGMQARLGFAVAAHLDVDLVVLDEVLSVGDAAFQAKCLETLERLKAEKRTLLLVTHQLEAAEQLCTHAVWLDHGHVRAQGTVHQVVAAYRAATAPHLHRAAGTAPDGETDLEHLPYIIEDIQVTGGPPKGTVRSFGPATVALMVRQNTAAGPIEKSNGGMACRLVWRDANAKILVSGELPVRWPPSGTGTWIVEARYERFPLQCPAATVAVGLQAGEKPLARDRVSALIPIDREASRVTYLAACPPMRWGADQVRRREASDVPTPAQ